MKGILVKTSFRVTLFLMVVRLLVPMSFLSGQVSAHAQAGRVAAASSATNSDPANLLPGSDQLITPEALVKILKSPTGEKPLILNIGPYQIYAQAHIPGAEYVGPSSDSQYMESLLKRVKPLAHNKFIVLYCGCCPWNHCPNVRPAWYQLNRAGFTRVKVLYIPDNLGTDWVYKGYPIAKGQ